MEAPISRNLQQRSSGLLIKQEERQASNSPPAMFISLPTVSYQTFFVNHQHYKSSAPFDLKSKIMILNKKSDVPRGYSMIVICDESMRNK